VPLRRYGEMDELRTILVFLMLDECSYVNGATIPIDGGHRLTAPSTFAELSDMSAEDWGGGARDAAQIGREGAAGPMTDVLLEETDGVATLRLNRPDKLNALSDAMVDKLLARLDEVARSEARVLVLTGEGRGFCAGFDLSLAGGDGDAAFWMARQEKFGSLVTKLRGIPQPTIAAVNGAAAGAGLGLALACDTRIGSTRCRFNSAFVKVGMSSCDIGVSWLLPRAIGTTRAFEMMLTGADGGG
jgi:1,4-dihydroxy-2-naphthoyl-CoA synthase